MRLFVRRINTLLLGREFNLINLQSLTLLIAFSLTLGSIIKYPLTSLSIPQANPKLASTYFLNHIQAGAIVESFESELLFLSPGIKYHFPSDLVSMQLQRRTTIDPGLTIDYDPLEAGPEYLVVGPMAGIWHLYDNVIDQGKVQLAADIGGYQIYHFLATSSV